MTTFAYNYQNSFRFCFVIEICQSRWGLKNNSPNLHKKTTNWRILVVVVKWRHRAIVLFWDTGLSLTLCATLFEVLLLNTFLPPLYSLVPSGENMTCVTPPCCPWSKNISWPFESEYTPTKKEKKCIYQKVLDVQLSFMKQYGQIR